MSTPFNSPSAGTGMPGLPTNASPNEQQAQAAARISTPAMPTRQAAQSFAQTHEAVNPLQMPFEWAGSKMYSIYSKYVSRPLSATIMVPQIAEAEDTQNGGGGIFGLSMSPFQKETWDRAWNDAAHVSPGQAAYKGVGTLFDSQGAWDKSMGYNKADGTILWDHPDQVQSFFDHGTQKWISGGTDAAFSWYADPTVLAGSGLKVGKYGLPGLSDLKDAAYLKPGEKVANPTFAGALTSAGIGGIGKALGVSPEGINVAQATWNARRFDTAGMAKNLAGEGVQGSTFTKLGNDLEAARKSQGPSFSGWAAKQGFAQSGGGALASALGQARNRQDIDDILGVAMGDNERAVSATNRSAASGLDVGAVAQAAGRTVPDTLPKYNAELGVQLQEFAQQKNTLYSQIVGSSPNAAAMKKLQMDMIDGHMQKIQQEVNFMDSLVGSHAYDTTGDVKYVGGGITPSMGASGVRYNTVLSPLTSKLNTWAEGVDYRALRGVTASKFAANLAYNNGFVRPVRLFSGQAWGDLRPNGWVNVEDPSSHLEVDAQIKNSKLFSAPERQRMVSSYINAASGQRSQVLQQVEADMTERMASKYGISSENASALYNHFNAARAGAVNRMYSTAQLTDKAGLPYYADQTLSSDGSMIVTHPILSSQLQNSHIMMDHGFMNTVLKYNARAFRNLKVNAALSDADAMTNVTRTFAPGKLATQAAGLSGAVTDVMNSLWKTNVLFRLGYGARALSDDFMGQIARFGAASMALRGISGGGLGLTKINSWMHDPLGWDQKFYQTEKNINVSNWVIDDIQKQHDAVAAKQYVHPTYIARQKEALADYQNQLVKEKQGLEDLKLTHASLLQTRSRMVDTPIILPNGQVQKAFASGPEGAVALNMNAGSRYAFDTGVGTAANALLGHIRGSDGGDWASIRRGASGFNEAWYRGVQMEIAHDPLAKLLLKGKSTGEAITWMQGAEGRAHFNSLKVGNMRKSDLAESVQAHVNKMLPATDAHSVNLRAAVAAGQDDAKVQQLMNKVPRDHQPTDIPGAGQRNYAMGKGSANNLLDRGLTGFYKYMSEAPTQVLSRNPLVAEMYGNHVNSAYKALADQGVTHLSQAQLDRISAQSRSLAIDDVKRFTYNMDHETKLAYMSRFIMPFFGPMQEPISRWARIAMDRPETLGRFAMMYNAPTRIGMETDLDGNTLDGEGYADDPANPGKKKLVPTDERILNFTLPDYLAKTLGVNGAQFKAGDGTVYTIKPSLSTRISSLPLPFRNDPWYNPGEGPFVQMIANSVAKDNPSLGDTMQTLGILPNGIKKSNLDILGGQLQRQMEPQDPKTAAQMALQIFASNNYAYENGLTKVQPTMAEAQRQAAHEAALNNWLAGGFTGAGPLKDILGDPLHLLTPINMKVNDPYQFFRDAYQNMAAANPQTARQLFYQKYGASAYGFTQSIMQDKYNGVPTTLKGLADEQKYQGLLDKYPDMAGVILGADANGAYSPTANALMQMKGEKTAMTPEAAWKDSQVSLGWQKYQQLMGYVTSQLTMRGLKTLSDPGAQDLKQLKSSWIASQASTYLPNGVTKNPYENKDWAEAYYGADPYTSDDKAAELTSILGDDPKLAKRQDMRGLAGYLQAREVAQSAMEQQRAESGSTATGPLDINSTANVNVKTWFQEYVMGLIQGNPAFQSLHDRYLANDMFDHYDGTNLTNTVYGGQ